MLVKTISSFTVLVSVSLLLSAAAVFDPASMPYSTIASYTVSNTNLASVTSAKAYRPWFENGAWLGDLVQYDLSLSGGLSTSVNLSTNPPTNSGANWSVRLQFDKKNNSYYQTQRKVLTTAGAATSVNINQKAFRWTSLSAAQQATIDAPAVGAASSQILDFIRGDRKFEINGSPGGLLRQRYNIMGDIVHSDPVYVAKPNAGFYDAGYAQFVSQNLTRPARVYAGANDGMLHVFDALTGDEVYAYIPSMLIPKLKLLSNIPYQHQYYVDGGLSAGDMDFGNSNWNSILVGSLGAGGKGLFALNITNANLTSDTSSTIADKKVLWELDGTNPNIGFIYDKSEIVKLPDGKWYVVSGNGHGSTNDTAQLLLIDSVGNVTSIEADNSLISNGLSRPTLIDINGDGLVDLAYAGDRQGNLYRFDLNTKLKADLLFSAGIDKPITTAPKLTNHPYGGRIIMFATGSLLSQADENNMSTQSIYGIRDYDTATFINNNNLLQQTLSADFAFSTTINIRYITNRQVLNWLTNDGWQVDLPAGERAVLDANLRSARFQVMSINPITQEAWLIQLHYLNAYVGSVTEVFYDLTGDQIFDASDTVNYTTDINGNPTNVGDIPIALKLGVGIFSRQLIARISNGVDANFINGLSIPPVSPPCFTNCPGGFSRGHIDVDTDSPTGGRIATNPADQYCYEKGDRAAGVTVDAAGALIPPSTNSPFIRTGTGTGDGLSGSTDGHQHEYDKAHGSVEVDYINTEAHCKQTRSDNSGIADIKVDRATEVGIGNANQFFVIVANADLSTESNLNIGTQSWNVVVYQKMIQQKLDAWVAAGASQANFASMMVDNGNSLIYTLDQIIATVDAGTGKFTNSFNDQAIVNGGLHPTITGCVNKSSSVTNGRWRNGALVTQLIDVDNYILNPSSIVKQNPSDLLAKVTVNGTDVVLVETNGIRYGGLHANSNLSSMGIGALNSSFLYESTLFWHFGSLYKLLNSNQPKPCYGASNWDVAKAMELAGISGAELTALINDPTNDLGKAYQDLQDAIANGDSQATIDELQNDYDKLLDKITDYVNKPGSPNNNPNQPYTPGTPVITVDKSNTLINQGLPNSMGRRSWIDIKP